MRKLFLLASFLFGGLALQSTYASEEIPLIMQIIKDGDAGRDNTKLPPRPLYITQEDYELSMPAFGDDYLLVLLDGNGIQVYSLPVAAGTTYVVLPSTLSGSYELRLETDTYYYIGYIVI